MMFETLLNAAQREAFNYFQGAVSRGLSANAIIKSYMDIGGQIRRSAALDLVRVITGQEKAADYFSHLKRDAIPDPRNIPIVRWAIKGNYYYNIEMVCFNNVTGDTFTKNVTVSSDFLMSRSQMEEEALKSFYGDREETQVSVNSMKPVRIGKKARTPMLPAPEEEIGRFGYS